MSTNNEAFAAKMLESLGSVSEFEPGAHYNQDSDCMEIIGSPTPFRTERVDEIVTAYYDLETGDLCGMLLKGVREILTINPGLLVELTDGRVKISALVQAAHAISAVRHPDKILAKRYRKLLDVAREQDLSSTVELCEA